jgi:hypothetical protein
VSFAQALSDGLIREIKPNLARAKNLQTAAYDSLGVLEEINVTSKSAKTIVRDLYECLRQCCEAKAYKHGFKFANHEVIKYFLKEKLKLRTPSIQFDRLRKIRNGINYYGDEVSVETAIELKENIPTFMEMVANATFVW